MDGGTRPIAVGKSCIESIIARRRVTSSLRDERSPVQLGVGIRESCGAAINNIHYILDRPLLCEDMMRVKLEMRSTFNNVRQDHMLEELVLISSSRCIFGESHDVQDRHTSWQPPWNCRLRTHHR